MRTPRVLYAVVLGVFSVNLAVSVTRFLLVRATESSGIFADFFHAASDSGTSIAVLVALFAASRRPTKRYPYGFRRIEPLFIFQLGLALAVSAVLLPGREAVERLFTEAHPRFTWFAFAVFCATIAGSVIVTLVEWSASRRYDSPLLHADAQHTLTDVFVSAGVAVGFLGITFGIPILDPIAGLLAAAFVVVIGARLMRENFRILINAPLPEGDPTQRH